VGMTIGVKSAVSPLVPVSDPDLRGHGVDVGPALGPSAVSQRAKALFRPVRPCRLVVHPVSVVGHAARTLPLYVQENGRAVRL